MPARKKKAVLVHLNDFVSVTPLVGGYLKAYALQDEEIRANWDIELYNRYVQTPASELLSELYERKPDLIGFSVYTWNVGLVLRLHEALRHVLGPSTQYLLGGVEVMHLGERFLQPQWENTSICNGEGELTFLEVLRHLASGAPALHEVNGLSLYRDGALITTPPNARIRHLADIPSPWLSDMFADEDMREVALFETNRGCPYACEFCYWGGAVGQRVTRLALDRIKDELTYIAKKGTKVLAFCDANIGLLPEDVAIAEHVAMLRNSQRAPTRVIINSAKNRIDRVEEIAKVYYRAGLLTTQAITLQSTNDLALKQAKRINKKDDYLQLMERLNKSAVPTFVELIWPMPGETLETFKAGIDDLCRRGAPSFFVHPLQWLNNVGFYERRDELGVATLRNEDPLSATENVIGTKEVSYPQYLQGMMVIFSLLLLYTSRGLYTTMHLLNALKIARFRDVLDDFAGWMNARQHEADDPVTQMWQDGHAHFETMCKGVWPGTVLDGVLREHRIAFDRLLQEYAEHRLMQLPLGEHAELIAAAVEYDHLTRPYIYLTRDLELGVALAHIEILAMKRGTWSILSPYDFPALNQAAREATGLTPALLARKPVTIKVDHRIGSLLPLPSWRELDYHWFATGTVRAIMRHEPRCSTTPPTGPQREAPEPIAEAH
ncbi:MAG: radical SAM protein [Pseudomonadota bacterium]